MCINISRDIDCSFLCMILREFDVVGLEGGLEIYVRVYNKKLSL